MTFDELEESWKNDLPDENCSRPPDLRQQAIATAHRTEFHATVFELYAMAVFGLLGVIALVDAIWDAKPWHSYPPPLIMLGVAAFVYSCRRLRRQQLDFSGSLPEIIERKLHVVDAHIGRVKAFLWWFIVPAILASVANCALNYADRPLWVWGLQPLAVIAVWLAMMMAVRSSHLPHRKVLRSIQQQLADNGMG